MTRIRIDRLGVRVRGARPDRATLAAAIARSLADHPQVAAAAGPRTDAASRPIADAVTAAIARKEQR